MTSALHRFELTPYRQRIALRVITGGVILSIAWALAGLTWRLAGHAGTGAVTVPAGQSARPAAVPDLTQAIALAPFGRGLTADAAPPTALALQLRGVIMARPETLSTAFISPNGEPARPFKIGDAVLTGTIEAIQRGRVLLRNGGRVESLAFPDPFAVAQAAQQTAAQPPLATGRAAGVAPPAAPSTAPPPLAVPPSPNGTPPTAELMTKFDATPTSGGYAVGANAPPGLQPGDVVQTLNGQPLGNPQIARDAFAKAQQSGNAQIQILRDGKRLTLSVPIR